jgi:hypothetical protein
MRQADYYDRVRTTTSYSFNFSLNYYERKVMLKLVEEDVARRRNFYLFATEPHNFRISSET